MRIKKSIQLTTKSLETLIENKSSIDFRLDQDSWKDLYVGDCVEFWEDFSGWDTEPHSSARKVVARIDRIYRAKTFTELFDVIESDSNNFANEDFSLAELRHWWSKEKETETGVLAFYVTLERVS